MASTVWIRPSGTTPAVPPLAEGLPLTAYEARLARVELCAARGDPASRPLAGEALTLAELGGYLVVVPRLRALTAVPPTTPA
jgi:hypothetical protein